MIRVAADLIGLALFFKSVRENKPSFVWAPMSSSPISHLEIS